MICPWLKTTTYCRTPTRDTTTEGWSECYVDECPWFRPNPDDTRPEPDCLRMVAEYNKARGGNNNGKG